MPISNAAVSAAPFALRLAEHVHGHLGWLAAATLIHPAIVLRRRGRRAGLAVSLAIAFVTVVSLVGAGLYADYRNRIKQQIFIHSPTVGLLFERKEHIAFVSVMLAWAGGAAYLAAQRPELAAAARATLHRAAHLSFVLSSLLAVAVAALGTVVASYSTF